MSAPAGGSAPGPAVSGLLVVDKPAGPTSFEVVKRVKRALGVRVAGHGGTLDPAATGVLAVLVGDAVRLQQFLSDGDKSYEAVVAFGAATTTEDAEGEVTERGDATPLDAARIRAALPAFTGLIRQVPPMYSAVRVGGRRLHEAARAGEEVAREPREVRVDALELVDLDPAPAPDGLRRARLRVRCGKGTYVRTLAADLGRALGVPAHLAALRRTWASGFDVAEATPLEAAEALSREQGTAALAARIVPFAGVLRTWSVAPVDARGVWDLVHGRGVAWAGAPVATSPQGLVRAVAPDGRLVALVRPEDGCLQPVRVFLGPAEVVPPARATGPAEGG